MLIFLAKAAVAGCLVAIVNLIAQRNPGVAGLIVAFPTVTLLSVLFLVIDRAPLSTIDELFVGILIGLVAGIAFVAIVIAGLRSTASLPFAMILGGAGWLLVTVFLQRLGIGR